MDRWTIEQLKKTDDIDFAVAILNERRSGLTNIYSPLSERLERAARTLEGLATLKRPLAAMIELPEKITQEECLDLADLLNDTAREAANSDPSTGIFPLPENELEALGAIEFALRHKGFDLTKKETKHD